MAEENLFEPESFEDFTTRIRSDVKERRKLRTRERKDIKADQERRLLGGLSKEAKGFKSLTGRDITEFFREDVTGFAPGKSLEETLDVEKIRALNIAQIQERDAGRKTGFRFGQAGEGDEVIREGTIGEFFAHGQGPLGGLRQRLEGPGALRASQLEKLREEAIPLEEQLDERLLANIEEESELRTGVTELTEKGKVALQEELQRRFEGIGVEAEEAREITGEAQSERGLLRSTFTQRKLEDINIEELEQKGAARLAAELGEEQIVKARDDLFKRLDDQRDMIREARGVEELARIEGMRNTLVESEMRQRMTQALAGAQISAAKKGALMGSLGSFIRTGITIAAISSISGGTGGTE